MSERIKGLGRGLGPRHPGLDGAFGDACRFRHIRIRVDKGCHSQLVNHGCPARQARNQRERPRPVFAWSTTQLMKN